MANIERRNELLSLMQLVHGCEGYERLSLDKYDRFTLDRSWRTLCPEWLYPLALSSNDHDVNAAVIHKIQDLFGTRVLHQVVPAIKSESEFVNLSVREVKQLFIDLAMVSEEDLRNAYKGEDDFETLSQDQYLELYQQVCPLTVEEVFCYEKSDFGAHASGFGEKPEGRRYLVSACMKIADKALKRKDKLSEVGFWDTFVKRGIGADTPVGTIYRLPGGLYKVSRHELLSLGCKLKVLVPLGKNKGLPPLVFFLPTQLHPLSHRQSLYRHIGADALVDALPRIKVILEELGVSELFRARIFGYSLGGLQADLFMNWAPHLVETLFASSIPGIEPSWKEMLNYCFPKDVASINATYTFNDGDGIRFYGGVQPPFGCKDRENWPVKIDVYQVSNAKERRVKAQRVSMANAFDVLHMTLTSFWGPHCRTWFLSNPSVVLLNNTKRLYRRLQIQSNMTMLNIEGVARRALVDFFNLLFRVENKKSFQIVYLEKLREEREEIFNAYIKMVSDKNRELYEYLAFYLKLPSLRINSPKTPKPPDASPLTQRNGTVLLPV